MRTPDQQALWDRFIKLGDMIGEGLHYEEKWISKDYNQLSKILMPDMHKSMRFSKNEARNKRVQEKLLTDKCNCGSDMKQTQIGRAHV